MDKTKKIWSIVLLCLQILLVVCMVFAALGLMELVDGSGELEGKEEALGWLLVMAALVFAIPMVYGFFGTVGLLISIINIKIARSKIIKIVSICFSIFYGIVLLASIGVFVAYGLIMHG